MTLETIILIAAFVALVGVITYAMIRTLKRNDQLIEAREIRNKINSEA